MEEQVRGLLSLGKTERRPQVDGRMDDFLAEVSALVAPACQHRSIAWELANETQDDAVIDDVEGLRTAIVNLALNAIEAAGEGGRVGLRVGYNDGRWTFDVNDTGPGPPPEIADHLFELFVTEKPEGVGFGLALARQVAEERGGTITWHRANDRTHFCLEIPAARTAGKTSIENLQGVSAP